MITSRKDGQVTIEGQLFDIVIHHLDHPESFSMFIYNNNETDPISHVDITDSGLIDCLHTCGIGFKGIGGWLYASSEKTEYSNNFESLNDINMYTRAMYMFYKSLTVQQAQTVVED